MADHASRIGRRLFVRRAGIVAAGASAAVAVCSPARAAPGSPLLAGAGNDADASHTQIRSAGAGPTLRLQNPNGAFVRVNPVPPAQMGDPTLGVFVVQQPLGSVYVGSDVAPSGQPPTLSWQRVMTTADTSMTVATTPLRVLDTRTAAGRASIIAGGHNIDGQGRLRRGGTIVVGFDDWVLFGNAVHMNVTVAKTGGQGYLIIWGAGDRPNTSAVNWWGTNQVLSNGVLSLLGTFGSVDSALAIYASADTSVVADLTAFDVGGPWQVNPGIVPGSGVSVLAARKNAAARAIASGAARSAGGPRHAAGPAVVAARRPGPRALRVS